MLIMQAITEVLETEEQLVTAAEIFENYQNAMFHTANSILQNTEDAEEAVGDTIIKICRHIDDFTQLPERERRLLVKKYTERTAIDKWRERKRKSTEVLDEYMLNTLTSDDKRFGSAEEIVFSGEEFGDLQRYVHRLPQKYRDILILKYVNDLKNKEIAELLHIPASTIGTHLHRAKQLLKKMLTEERSSSWL